MKNCSKASLTISKNLALRFAKQYTPLYAELYQEFKADGGRVKFPSRFGKIRSAVAKYVELYDNELKPGVSIFIGLLGEKGFHDFNALAASWSEQDTEEFLENFGNEESFDALLDSFDIPQSEAEWTEQEKALESIPETEQAKAAKIGAFFFSGIFAHFFNTFSLMTHGATLVSLVLQAMQGDDEAFGKAVQVDRNLLTHHPFFVSRKQLAQDEGDTSFLRMLAYRESNPNLKGKIQYPALFMLFGMLEQVGWLDKLRHEEILDLCDEIGLDRFQNRIEDVNYLTKRLADYRRFQKTGGVSML